MFASAATNSGRLTRRPDRGIEGHFDAAEYERQLRGQNWGACRVPTFCAQGRDRFAQLEHMNLNDLANLGQIIGAVAVVISLFYVASQIRQNTNAVRSATAQTVHEHFAKWYHLVAADDELSQIVAKGLRDYGSLSEKERVRFIAAFMSFLSYSQNAFLKWREGLLASPLWMGWQHVIMNLVGAPGGKAFWKDRAYMFGDEFRRYIESDLMKRQPHPDAKPMGVFSIAGANPAHESHEPR